MKATASIIPVVGIVVVYYIAVQAGVNSGLSHVAIGTIAAIFGASVKSWSKK